MARIHEFDADYGPALAALREAIAIREKAARTGDWVLVDDRFAVQRLGRLSELDAAKRARFREVLRLHDRASTLGKKSYRVGEAIAVLKQAAQMTKEIVGADHPEYASALDRLANYEKIPFSLRREDDPSWRRVNDLYSQAREIRARTLGENHPDCATSLENLYAFAPTGSEGISVQAEPLLRQALEIRRQSQGDRHPEYAQCLRKLANHSERKSGGNADEALELYQQALRIDRELFGPDDLVCDADLQALARIYRKRGRHRDGREARSGAGGIRPSEAAQPPAVRPYRLAGDGGAGPRRGRARASSARSTAW